MSNTAGPESKDVLAFRILSERATKVVTGAGFIALLLRPVLSAFATLITTPNGSKIEQAIEAIAGTPEEWLKNLILLFLYLVVLAAWFLIETARWCRRKIATINPLNESKESGGAAPLSSTPIRSQEQPEPNGQSADVNIPAPVPLRRRGVTKIASVTIDTTRTFPVVSIEPIECGWPSVILAIPTAYCNLGLKVACRHFHDAVLSRTNPDMLEGFDIKDDYPSNDGKWKFYKFNNISEQGGIYLHITFNDNYGQILGRRVYGNPFGQRDVRKGIPVELRLWILPDRKGKYLKFSRNPESLDFNKPTQHKGDPR